MRVLGEGVVALEGGERAVVRVDVLAGRDVGSVAKPMIWPNFRTGWPLAIAPIAILWPRGMRGRGRDALDGGAGIDGVDRDDHVVAGH